MIRCAFQSSSNGAAAAVVARSTRTKQPSRFAEVQNPRSIEVRGRSGTDERIVTECVP